MEAQVELKPCPCCGGNPIIVPCGNAYERWYEVECADCSLAVGYDAEHELAATQEEAAAQWNRRDDKGGMADFTPDSKTPLRLCPFCGGEPCYNDFDYPGEDGIEHAHMSVECLDCPAGNGRAGGKNPLHESDNAAAAAWNRRVLAN